MDYKYKAGVQGLCPPGWHIPEISEWNEALKIFPDKGIDLLYYLGPQSPSGFNLEFYGMMNIVNPGDSTVGYYYDGSTVAYWCSDRPIKILQNPDENINRIVFRRNYWSIVYHLYRRADHSIQDPLYTYASYVRCFKNQSLDTRE